jgi:hypothetical protein
MDSNTFCGKGTVFDFHPAWFHCLLSRQNQYCRLCRFLEKLWLQIDPTHRNYFRRDLVLPSEQYQIISVDDFGISTVTE